MPRLILLKPIFSEKAQGLAAKGRYTFEVVRDSNKIEIRKAVEEHFDVKVDKVRTQNTASEIKRQGRYYGKTKSTKRAIVTVTKGTIDYWVPPEKDKTKDTSRKSKKGKEEKKEDKK